MSTASEKMAADFAEMMKSFDPARIASQFNPNQFTETLTKMAKDYQGPDSTLLLDSQKKNVAALVAASEKMAEGVRETLEHQSRVLAEVVEGVSRSYDKVIQSSDPRETAIGQLNAIKESCERSLKDMKKVGAIMNKSGEQAMQALNQRICEGIDEIRKGVETGKTS